MKVSFCFRLQVTTSTSTDPPIQHPQRDHQVFLHKSLLSFDVINNRPQTTNHTTTITTNE